MKNYNGRKVNSVIDFKKSETFKAYYEACKYCSDNGYSYGSMCGHEPIALYKGDCSISKWRNLSDEEKNTYDGVMIGDFRDGDVTILIF